MATFTASHYLYMTKQQRYDLHSGKEVQMNGVLIPVWFEKGNTSEPAKEVFCEYTLRNTRKKSGVEFNKKGFVIDMPYFEIAGGENTDREILRAAQQRIGTSELLLDLDDGGLEHCEFRYFHKKTIAGKKHNVIHFVEIKPLDVLDDTMS